MKGSNKSALNVMAYIAFIVIAILIVINNLLPGFAGETLIKILETAKNVLVLIVLGIMGFNFASGSAKWVKIIYWIALVIFVAGTIILWAI